MIDDVKLNLYVLPDKIMYISKTCVMCLAAFVVLPKGPKAAIL